MRQFDAKHFMTISWSIVFFGGCTVKNSILIDMNYLIKYFSIFKSCHD